MLVLYCILLSPSQHYYPAPAAGHGVQMVVFISTIDTIMIHCSHDVTDKWRIDLGLGSLGSEERNLESLLNSRTMST